MNKLSEIAMHTVRQASRARSWEEANAHAETGLANLDLLTDAPLLDQSIQETRRLASLQPHAWLKGPVLFQALEDLALMAAGTNVVAEIARAASRRGEAFGRADQASAAHLQALQDIALVEPDSGARFILEKARGTANDREFYLILEFGVNQFVAKNDPNGNKFLTDVT